MGELIRRNEKCFCGSGKRFKHCHGALSIHRQDAPIENWHEIPQRVRDAFNQKQAERVKHFEKIGFHRPPLIAGTDGNWVIVRGNELLRWKGRGNFLNFLEADLLHCMGESFRNAANHPLNVWWKAMRGQAERRRHLGKNRGLASTAAVLNFFLVANDLFVLSDNSKLRDRLLKSLRVAQEFHGARYELMIASCLIRGGFIFEFSDEEEITRKHSDSPYSPLISSPICQNAASSHVDWWKFLAKLSNRTGPQRRAIGRAPLLRDARFARSSG